MIKIKYSHYKGMSGTQFMQALHKLLSVATSSDTAYKLRKVCQPLKKGADEVFNSYKKDIIEKFAKKNEAGEIDENNPELPEDGKDPEFDKAIAAFEEKEIQVGRPLLTAHDLRDAKLTGNEMEAIELIVDEKSFEKAGEPQGRQGMRLA